MSPLWKYLIYWCLNFNDTQDLYQSHPWARQIQRARGDLGGQWLIPGSCEIRLQLDKASAVRFYISNEELLNYPPYIIVKYDAGFDIYGSNTAAHAYTASVMFGTHMHESSFFLLNSSTSLLNLLMYKSQRGQQRRWFRRMQCRNLRDTREEVVDPQRFWNGHHQFWISISLNSCHCLKTAAVLSIKYNWSKTKT